MSQTTASTSDRPDRSLDEVYQSWSQAAAAVVAKSRRTTVEELPATAEELLSTETIDGLRIRPLYTRKDETAESGLPGGFPFVRGADPDRDVTLGWRVTERFGDDDTPPGEVNRQILEALENGTSGLWLRIGGALTVTDLDAVLDGVYLDLIPVTVDAGADGIAAARALLEQQQRASAAPEAPTPTVATITSFGFSPLTAAFSGRPDVDVDEATAIAAEAIAGVRTFRVDGTDFATAGADHGLELALIVAAAVTHLRDLTAAGMSAADALNQITFAVSAGDDQFATIAKFRALRRIWSRVAEVVGAPDAGAAATHAVTDLSMQTQRDPWVNMLRTTIAAFGAGIGGADQVTVLGFDAAIPAEHRTSSATFSRRIARNTQLLLLEESNIGRVLDPAGGSWFVETLTDEMAANAWTVFGEIEAAGGYRRVLESGWIGDRVGASLARRDESVAHRTIAVTGVNEFPNLDEKPLGAPTADTADLPLGTPRLARVGRVFEELRDRSDGVLAATGARPSVLMLPLGSVAEHNARTTFVANLLAAGGISAINPGPVSADEIGELVREHQASIAVLCASKQRYADDGAAALAAARATDLSSVLMAGPEKEWPDDQRPDGSLRIGIDAVATLRGLLDQLTNASAGATS
ncbi:MAG: methylmalonyl-CoA mutase [Gordonia sp.]|uniref:methylmalonyl-CoA mutase family protein n=1 Tax=Gordonia sp. (in: high G+C Gram-positive bacteria) TaxID=84139 RepID=UPI000C50F8E9|nr:methylmalonyl-CoA mutase family protein [Gordonia sp. (in: high G+C Gram-positive bacteria)]MAU82808.1 methylmalonyl-CoA mutase [Gordonia sp. (in: high G+C Gram-positive bacteria)]